MSLEQFLGQLAQLVQQTQVSAAQNIVSFFFVGYLVGFVSMSFGESHGRA